MTAEEALATAEREGLIMPRSRGRVVVYVRAEETEGEEGGSGGCHEALLR